MCFAISYAVSLRGWYTYSIRSVCDNKTSCLLDEKLFKPLIYCGLFGVDGMNSQFDERYNEKRPILSFRVSPEVKDQLSELQDGSNKTVGELAENVITEALLFSNKNHKSGGNAGYPNRNNNDVNAGNDIAYDNGFKNGYKNGSNHVKNNTKKLIQKNGNKTNDDIKKQIQKFLDANKDECGECGGTFINDNFDFCPYCKIEFIKDEQQNQQDNSVLGFDMQNFRVPILSDILDSFGSTGQEEETLTEENTRERNIGEEKRINFVGRNQNKKEGLSGSEEFENECEKCGHEFDGTPKFCPGCGQELEYD